MYDERQLSERCARGEKPACRELYDSYAGRLLALSTRYVGSVDSAEDIWHFCAMRRTVVMASFGLVLFAHQPDIGVQASFVVELSDLDVSEMGTMGGGFGGGPGGGPGW